MELDGRMPASVCGAKERGSALKCFVVGIGSGCLSKALMDMGFNAHLRVSALRLHCE